MRGNGEAAQMVLAPRLQQFRLVDMKYTVLRDYGVGDATA
jgi:hypothetical protein